MSDLVQRLRALVILDEVRSDNPLGREAAARIEALETALREIVQMLVYERDEDPGDYEAIVRFARAALAPEQNK